LSKEGKLHHFDKGDAFVCVGHVMQYLFHIKSGTIKDAEKAADSHRQPF
jgi:hypothetical protein